MGNTKPLQPREEGVYACVCNCTTQNENFFDKFKTTGD